MGGVITTGHAVRERHGRAVSDLAAGLVSGALEAALVQTPNQAVQVKMVHDQSPQGPHRYRSLLHAVGLCRDTIPPAEIRSPTAVRDERNTSASAYSLSLSLSLQPSAFSLQP